MRFWYQSMTCLEETSQYRETIADDGRALLLQARLVMDARAARPGRGAQMELPRAAAGDA